VLDDGTYDAIVVDATEIDGTVDGTDLENFHVRLELTIVAGPHKGEIVVVRARHLTMTAVETLGLPARVVVTDGQPEVVLER
jgi:hypothetical protein